MHLLKEELWKIVDHPAIYVVTANNTITKDGYLVMGRGAAKQATERIEGIEYESADAIKKFGWEKGLPTPIQYGFLTVRPPRPETGRYGFGLFQVKDRWDENAKLDIISTSVERLHWWAFCNPEITIRMNYPGIGNGGLKQADVANLIRNLPDNIYIFHY